LLELSDVHKHFGGVRAVDGVSVRIDRNELVGLIGPNGSGKSTLFNVISGVFAPDAGEIYFEGERIDGLEPYDVFARGIVRSFQNPRLFVGMNVFENVMLAPRHQVGEHWSIAPFRSRWASQEAELAEKATETLHRMTLTPVALNRASEVSGGQMKLLEISRALAAEPKLLLLDEPTAGVAPKLSRQIFDSIRLMRDELGFTFLIVEHRLDVLFDYVERVLVMNNGRLIADGRPDEVVRDQRVIDAYLGESY